LKGFKYKSQTLKLKPVSIEILNPHTSIPFHCNSQPIRLLMGVHHNSISLHYDDTYYQWFWPPQSLPKTMVF